jgi:divalent metal cation (Fe/Co/Zn/Cd) transporter
LFVAQRRSSRPPDDQHPLGYGREAYYQGVAAVLIALVLIRVSLRLIQRSHDFLVGAWTGAAGGRGAAMLLASPSPSGQLMRSKYEPSCSPTPG